MYDEFFVHWFLRKPNLSGVQNCKVRSRIVEKLVITGNDFVEKVDHYFIGRLSFKSSTPSTFYSKNIDFLYQVTTIPKLNLGNSDKFEIKM